MMWSLSWKICPSDHGRRGWFDFRNSRAGDDARPFFKEAKRFRWRQTEIVASRPCWEMRRKTAAIAIILVEEESGAIAGVTGKFISKSDTPVSSKNLDLCPERSIDELFRSSLWSAGNHAKKSSQGCEHRGISRGKVADPRRSVIHELKTKRYRDHISD